MGVNKRTQRKRRKENMKECQHKKGFGNIWFEKKIYKIKINKSVKRGNYLNRRTNFRFVHSSDNYVE